MAGVVSKSYRESLGDIVLPISVCLLRDETDETFVYSSGGGGKLVSTTNVRLQD